MKVMHEGNKYMIILITIHHYLNKIQLLCPVLPASILPSDLVTKAVSTLKNTPLVYQSCNDELREAAQWITSP